MLNNNKYIDMKTRNNIYRQWALLLILLIGLPLGIKAQTDKFEMVLEKIDGTELTFRITDDYPLLQYQYGGEEGINTIAIQTASGFTSVPCPEIKRLFTRVVVDIDPVQEDEDVSFKDEITEETDLSNTVIDNTYFNMDAENGDGYDATEQAIVLNSTTTEEQMNAVENAEVGDAAVSENYNGIIFEVPASKGFVTVDVKTIGTHVLNVQIGKGEPTKVTKSERGTVDVAYNVSEPTYVYLYATTDNGSSAAIRRTPDTAANSVLLYGYKITIGDTGIHELKTGQVVDVFNLQGNKVRVNVTSLEGLPKGLYIMNGRKVVVK